MENNINIYALLEIFMTKVMNMIKKQYTILFNIIHNYNSLFIKIEDNIHTGKIILIIFKMILLEIYF